MRRAHIRSWRVAVVVVGAFGVAAASACSSDDAASTPNTAPLVSTADSTTSTTSTTPTTGATTPVAPLAEVGVELTQVATLDSPIALSWRPGDDALWIAQRGGGIVRMSADGTTIDEVLNLSDRVGDITSEQGLLGLAWSPDGTTLAVSYTDGNDGGASVIERHNFDIGSTASNSSAELLRVAQPFANHNGGNIAFGPDSMLWIGFGDGGGQGDPDNRSQRTSELLGKLLRIDVTSGATPYGVPASNPFATSDSARREIAALGLRNPWRFSFDRATGDLWIGDVGGSAFEEVNVLRAADGYTANGGAVNFGWRVREGFEATDAADDTPSAEGAAFTDPVYAYDHSVGSSITGGYVVRDPRLSDLDGVYLFSDFAVSKIWALRTGVQAPEVAALGTGSVEPYAVASFGEGPNGEVYVISLEGPIWRIDPPTN